MSNPVDIFKKLDAYFPGSTWSQAWEQAFIPADGDVVTRTRTITEQFKVKYQEDGTITYTPIKQDSGEFKAESK